MRQVLLIVSLAVLVACGARPVSSKGLSNAHRGVVVRAVDGDTLVVREGDKDVRVRLLGVDTPETHDPRKPVQCFGPQAAAFTASYAKGRVTVTIEPATGDSIDRYGRTLAYVYVQAHRVDLGAALIRRGFARVYAFNNRHFVKRSRYEFLEMVAKSKLVGRWRVCHG